MGTARRWWLVATLAVAASLVAGYLLGGFGGLGVLLLLGELAGATGLDLGHAGPFLLLGVAIPVTAALTSVPAMVVVRSFRGAHPVLGPFAAVCAGLPVAGFVGGVTGTFTVGTVVAAVVEVLVLGLLIRRPVVVPAPAPEPVA